MPKLGAAKTGRLALFELLAYASVAGLFLCAYIPRFNAPPSVILPHLCTVAAALIPFPLLRMLCWKFLPAGRLRTLLVALLLTTPLLALTIWYALVLVGLDAWGRVITWPLIRTYSSQAPHLIRILDVPAWLPVCVIAAASLGIGALAWRIAANRDWTTATAEKFSRTGTATICVLGTTLSPLILYVLLGQHTWHAAEPIALGFVAKKYAGLQSHAVAGASALDAKEDAARLTYSPAQSHRGRNVIIIVGDALRSQHMSALGYSRTTTPHIEKRINTHDHLVVQNMRSACAESSCGLMALAASRSVSELGSKPFTLQEVLRLNGYQAHFIMGGDHTNFYGLRTLYGELDSFFDGSNQTHLYINDDQLVLNRLEMLPTAVKEQPVMLQFHLMSTHGLGSRNDKMSPFSPASNYYAWPGPSPRRAPSPSEALHAINYYDNGMVRFDHTVDAIISKLQDKGYLDDAIVIITGDHGEMLGETGHFSHQYGLSEPALDIPFIMLRFGYKNKDEHRHTWSGQVDIAPTILHELNIPSPDAWSGLPLQIKWPIREIKLQQDYHFGVYRISETGEVWKYVRNVKSGSELAHIPTTDPLGQVNVLDEIPITILNRWRASSGVTLLNTLAPSEIM